MPGLGASTKTGEESEGEDFLLKEVLGIMRFVAYLQVTHRKDSAHFT